MGYTAEQAEPRPDRNMPEYPLNLPLMDIQDADALESMYELQRQLNSLTHGIGQYGGMNMVNFRSVRAPPGLARRLNTGHFMTFPIEPPVEMPPAARAAPVFLETPAELLRFAESLENMEGMDGMSYNTPHPVREIRSHIPMDLLANSGLGDEQAQHTLAALSSAVPQRLLNALINVPETPSLAQWHEECRREAEVHVSAAQAGNGRRPARQSPRPARRSPLG